MIKVKILYFILLILTMHGCADRCKPDNVENGKFDGNAIAFYYKPVSGRICEVRFIPICRNQMISVDNENDIDFNDITSSKGVSVGISQADLAFRNLFEMSKKLKLIHRDSSAQEYQYIYFCPVKLKFSGVVNDTPRPNNTGENFLEENLEFSNGQVFKMKYIFSASIKIESLSIPQKR